MSKINNVRLPNAIEQNYSPDQFNQLVRSLEQVIFQLNSTYTPTTLESKVSATQWMAAGSGAGGGFAGGIRGFQASNGIILPNAMLLSDIDQSNAGVTSENILTYTSAPVANGINFTDNSRIRVSCAGQYLVTFSLQVTNRGNTPAVFEVWAKDTGVNFPSSTTRFDLPVRKSSTEWSHVVPMISGIFSVEDPSTEYLEIAWWADSLDVYLEHYPTNTSPARPAIPSVILTINFISAN